MRSISGGRACSRNREAAWKRREGEAKLWSGEEQKSVCRLRKPASCWRERLGRSVRVSKSLRQYRPSPAWRELAMTSSRQSNSDGRRWLWCFVVMNTRAHHTVRGDIVLNQRAGRAAADQTDVTRNMETWKTPVAEQSGDVAARIRKQAHARRALRFLQKRWWEERN